MEYIRMNEERCESCGRIIIDGTVCYHTHSDGFVCSECLEEMDRDKLFELLEVELCTCVEESDIA